MRDLSRKRDGQITPHGGKLVDRVARGKELERLLERAPDLMAVTLDHLTEAELWLIGVGAYSPLEGFMTKEQYEGVLAGMRLSDGTIWSLPVTLDCDADTGRRVSKADLVKLVSKDRRLRGFLAPESVFPYDRLKEADLVFGTRDPAHPGVARLLRRGAILLGGRIWLVEGEPGSHGSDRRERPSFAKYRLSPWETRRKFQELGWRRIVAFQTRNPIHRAHEYIQKCALEMADGLFLHPLVGDTKIDDVPAEIRVRSYEALISSYFPPNRVLMAVFPAAMRYAGPREAVFHALVRKNYGCTHIIIGRDHAGTGGYYGPYDAQRIFDRFNDDELGIQPLFFEDVFYCTRCGGMASLKTCPHGDEYKLSLSGTKVRDMLEKGVLPPGEFMREEVARVLAKGKSTSSECAGFSGLP